MITKLLVMTLCKIFNKKFFRDDATFYSHGYIVSFKNTADLDNNYWQNVNVQVYKIKDDGTIKGVAFFPKQSNAFSMVNPIFKYFSSYKKIFNGEILDELPFKSDIKAFNKAIWWFPFKAKLDGAFI